MTPEDVAKRVRYVVGQVVPGWLNGGVPIRDRRASRPHEHFDFSQHRAELHAALVGEFRGVEGAPSWSSIEWVLAGVLECLSLDMGPKFGSVPIGRCLR